MRKELAEITDRLKYRDGEDETKEEKSWRLARATADDEDHSTRLYDIFNNDRFLMAGRIQAAMGASKQVTAFNCFVSPVIEDDFDSIFEVLKKGGQTLRLGGGDGFDFSRLRPSGSHITTLDTSASGPLSFMDCFDSMCKTVVSAGHRRGAMMGVLRVDHPDIEAFIKAKHNEDRLRNFNISIGITDDFMRAVEGDEEFELVHDGRVYKRVNARALWDNIMRSTWDWAEPGVLFLDTINRKNNLHAIETITATNPCGEQPLPPNGACLLGSFNLVAYLRHEPNGWYFDYRRLVEDIHNVVPAMDNIIDRTIYPLPEQKQEALSKRRMGLGVTGVANAMEILGYPYGSKNSKEFLSFVLENIRDECYKASIRLAIKKGPFPLFNANTYGGDFFKTLPEEIIEDVKENGIRNSHLLSIAPTGTISLVAGNVSSGIEPPFSLEYDRNVIFENGRTETYRLEDYAYDVHDIKGVTADELSGVDHVDMLNLASKYVDSSVSKTCNVGPDTTFEEFKDLYMRAYKGGASGCTTFRSAGMRGGILKKIEETVDDGAACFIDPNTGLRTCE